MHIVDKINGLKELLDAALPDAVKAEKGNAAAKRRVRKSLQAVRTECFELRKCILESK